MRLISIFIFLFIIGCNKEQDLTTNAAKCIKTDPAVISGIKFSEIKSLDNFFNGVNSVRGSQNITLILDEFRNLEIIDSSQSEICAVTIQFYKDQSSIGVIYNKSEHLSRKQFTERLKELFKMNKSIGGKKFPIFISFDEHVTGEDGLTILQELCDYGFMLIFSRDETKEMQEARLDEALLKKPSSPGHSTK